MVNFDENFLLIFNVRKFLKLLPLAKIIPLTVCREKTVQVTRTFTYENTRISKQLLLLATTRYKRYAI